MAGGQAGSGPPPRSVLSWSENPATGRLYQRGIVPQDDDVLSAGLILCAISAHHSCLLPLPLPPFVATSLPVPPLPRAQKVCPSVRLSSAERLEAGCEKLPKVRFFFFFEDERWDAASPSWIVSVLLLLVFSLIQSSALSLYLLALLLPLPFCQPGCLASCPIPLKRKSRGR